MVHPTFALDIMFAAARSTCASAQAFKLAWDGHACDAPVVSSRRMTRAIDRACGGISWASALISQACSSKSR